MENSPPPSPIWTQSQMRMLLADHKRNVRRSCRYDPPPQASPSFTNLEHDGEGEEWACSCHQPINLPQSVCQPKQVQRQYWANLNVVSHALLSSTSIAHLVLLLLSSVSYKIFCPTYLHSLLIWLWWGTSIFVLIPHHPTPDSYLVFWSLSISSSTLTFLPTRMVILSTLWFVLPDAMFSLFRPLIGFWTTSFLLLLSCKFHPIIVGPSHKLWSTESYNN